MSDDQKRSGQVPYEPVAGGRSILAGLFDHARQPTRAQQLTQPIRAFTIDWLAVELSIASRAPFGIARQALVEAIPNGEESVLDGGAEFIFCVDEAAIRLGCDPLTVALKPLELHS